MSILFIVVDISLAVWGSIGYPFWMYCLNVLLVVIASSFFDTSTVQAIKTGRFFLFGHAVGLVLALIAFRFALFIFPIWLVLQILESVYVVRRG